LAIKLPDAIRNRINDFFWYLTDNVEGHPDANLAELNIVSLIPLLLNIGRISVNPLHAIEQRGLRNQV
jgi:hypothetical protein